MQREGESTNSNRGLDNDSERIKNWRMGRKSERDEKEREEGICERVTGCMYY